jgi:hypothetical protein
MRINSTCLTILMMFAISSVASAQEAGTDSIDTDVRSVTEADSTLVAGAGNSQKVSAGSHAVVYVPFFYRGEQYKNRVARGIVVSTTDSTCQVRLAAETAPVRPGYRILLYQVQPPVIPPLADKTPAAKKVPFYKRKWFWPVVGAAVITTVIITAGGGGSSSNQGTVSIGGNLP